MSNIDQSIAHMMEVLNPKQRRRTELRTTIDFESPLKRRLSSDSSADTPDKRSKTENSLDVSWIASPREARRLRSDLLESRNYITDLEHRIQHMHGVRKELQTMFDNEIKSLQLQHTQDADRIKELEEQMHSIRKREKEAKEELEEVQTEMRQNKMEYELRIEDLEFTVNELQSQLEVFEGAECEQLSMIQTENNELSEAVKNAEKETQLYKDLVADLKSRLVRLTNISNDIEVKDQMLQSANMKIKELEYTIESYGEWQIQSKLQQKKLINYPDLEKEVQKLREEARNLRDEVQNKLILEEQVHDLNIRLERYRTQDKTLTQLQVTNAQLEQIVNEWYNTARDFVETPCTNSALPRQLRQVVDHLQQQEITLHSEKIQLESQLKACQQDLKILKAENEKFQKMNSDLQTNQQQHQALVHRLQKKLQLVSRERDSYRLQLDSYEKDLTVNIIPGVQGTSQVQLTAQKERIDNLEKIVEGYREMISNLETQLRDAQPQLNPDNLIPVRFDQMTRLQEELERLRNENSRLVARKDELEIRLEEELIGKDPVAGKVIHMKLNPLSECISENETNIEKLREEIDRLKRKIRNMEEGLESSKLSESICSSREVQVLKEENKSLEIKMQRLKEFFKSSSHEFREVCYMLFGYKMDRVSSTMYKLSSMYAETSEDHLEFQLKSDGTLNMIETQFSSTLDELIDLHLRHHCSIPAFLSAVTIDLFNRTTISSRTYAE